MLETRFSGFPRPAFLCAKKNVLSSDVRTCPGGSSELGRRDRRLFFGSHAQGCPRGGAAPDLERVPCHCLLSDFKSHFPFMFMRHHSPKERTLGTPSWEEPSIDSLGRMFWQGKHLPPVDDTPSVTGSSVNWLREPKRHAASAETPRFLDSSTVVHGSRIP